MDDEFEKRLTAIQDVITEVIEKSNADRKWLAGRFDFVEGQLFATTAALRALIRTTPGLAEKAAAAIEQLAATTLHTASSDEFLRGIETAKNHLRLPPT